jgi:hypothetical protein
MNYEEEKEYQEKMGGPEMEYLQYQMENPKMTNSNLLTDHIKEGEEEVVLAEEGTPLADFQKARTDAISRMFERDEMCGTIHTTSRFFAELDTAFTSLLATRQTELYEKVRETIEKIPLDKLIEANIEDGTGGVRDFILSTLDNDTTEEPKMGDGTDVMHGTKCSRCGFLYSHSCNL